MTCVKIYFVFLDGEGQCENERREDGRGKGGLDGGDYFWSGDVVGFMD